VLIREGGEFIPHTGHIIFSSHCFFTCNNLGSVSSSLMSDFLLEVEIAGNANRAQSCVHRLNYSQMAPYIVKSQNFGRMCRIMNFSAFCN